MFQDLDDTLTKVLDDEAMKRLTPPLTELFDAEVSFITPDKNFTPGQTTQGNTAVDLFLYDVKENRELRDPVPIVEKVGNTFVRRKPPLRMDCSYIVTAWSSSTSQARVVEEHRLLSQAVQWLSRFPTIPDNYLQGTLKEQPFPPPMWVAQMDPNTNAGEFWNALGISPRSAFYLTATVAMDVGVREEGFLVTTRTTSTETAGETAYDNWVQAGGQILTSSGQGIPGALVDIVGAGLRTKSDSDGRYSFPRVPVGKHDIRVVAAGFQPQTQKLDIPGLPGSYDITMTPL
jgi:hypothetical protein